MTRRKNKQTHKQNKHNKTKQHETNETTNKKKQAFCERPTSGNQVDGLPLALHNKDAESASWQFCGRACDHKIY